MKSKFLLASAVACVLLGLAACSSGVAAEPAAPAEAAASCVTDIDAVIAAEPAAAMSTSNVSPERASALDAAARSSFTEAAAPGAIVGVATPEGTWTAAYGEADPATGAPMEVGMHTRIGSVTKTFTGTVLLQLAQEGLLRLDDPIADYVEGVPNGEKITLRQMAEMVSGIASYTQTDLILDDFFRDPARSFTPDELVKAGLHDSPIFAPGAQFNYSNTNTVLLGLVIEQVTGEPIDQVFQERIFEPLGLTDTVWPGDSGELPEPYAQGFTLQQGNQPPATTPVNATNWNPSWGFTAGELVSNMHDLLVYGRALGTGQGLLSPATQQERLESFPGAAGYGIALGCIDGWVGHTGELPGYNTSVFYDTTTDTTVVVQVNSDISSGDCAASPTMTDDPRDLECSSPATRMFMALSTALGHTFTPNPQS